MASKRKTTIKDIADAAGVSVALVSFVMNNMSGGKYRVSAKTTKKILSISNPDTDKNREGNKDKDHQKRCPGPL